jgi:hypothetical protein
MKNRKRPDDSEEARAMVAPSSNKRGKGRAALGRDIQAKLGQQLRVYYDRLIEPTPQRFIELLRELDKGGGKDSAE